MLGGRGGGGQTEIVKVTVVHAALSLLGVMLVVSKSMVMEWMVWVLGV